MRYEQLLLVYGKVDSVFGFLWLIAIWGAGMAHLLPHFPLKLRRILQPAAYALAVLGWLFTLTALGLVNIGVIE